MSPTIRDVAKKANVGIATVSRVINNNTSVSAETRNAVLTAIEELDYTPNPIARQLSTGRTLTIGVIVPNLTSPSYVERLRGVQTALAESEYHMVLYSVGNPVDRDNYFKELSRNGLVDGILIISLPPNDAQAERFAQSDVPTVLIDAYHEQLCSVLTDDVKGGEMATQHLIDLGHTKIGFLSETLETPFHPSSYYRYQGYRKALTENNIPFDETYRISGASGRMHAREMARQLLAMQIPPSAIFAGNDIQAIGILDTARELQIEVPSELSVIGFDGIRDAEYTNLTTIDQHLHESGEEGVKMLLQELESLSDSPAQKRLALKLVQRNTTRPLIG